MLSLRHFSRYLSVFLVLTLLTARIGAVSHHAFVEPIQNYISKKAQFVEDHTPKKTTFYKGKRSVSDLLTTTDTEIAAVAPPPLAVRFPAGLFQPLPEVYLDIFIPPDPAPLST